MKLEPPVPVPVDSILSWGCGGGGVNGGVNGGGDDDDDDLLGGKFTSCDMADSTTGGMHDHLHSHQGGSGMAGSSSGSVMLSCGGGGQPSGPMNHSNRATLLQLDNLDNLLLSGATVLTTPTTPGPGPGGGHSFAELKPLALPPFDYGGGNLSLDGSGTSHLQHHLNNSAGGGVNGGGTRTVLDINLNLYKASSNGNNNNNSNNNNLNYYGGAGGEQVSTTTLVNGLVGVVRADNMGDYLMNPEIDDIAAIIGNAIADSTVASAASAVSSAHHHHQHQGGGGVTNVGNVGLGGVESLGPDIRDPWADIDAWIESACSTVYKHEPMLESPASSVTSGTSHSSLSSVSPAFAHPSSLPPMSSLQQPQQQQQQQQHNNSCSVSSTLQALLSQGAATAGNVALAHMSHDPSGGGNQSLAVKSEPSMDMPLLQRRLTAGREPNNMSGNNGSSNGPMGGYVSCSMQGSSSSTTKELQLPHTTFHTGSGMNHVTTSLSQMGGGTGDSSVGCHSSSYPATARRSTAVKSSSSSSYNNSKDLSDLDDPLGLGSGGSGGGSSGGGGGGGGGRSKHKNRSGKAKMTTVMTTDGNGKEKPVHRCNICNRGFLNKSNIKVHLRTHTGEKPFKCDACAKAFRQKAHLLKHMQIHKRITRD